MYTGPSEFIATDAEFAERLRRALRSSPVSVSLLTALEPDGRYCGLAVTSATPFSTAQPSLIVAINHAASAFPAVSQSGRFCVNQITSADLELLDRFVRSDLRASRFAKGEWRTGLWGLPYLQSANASLFCQEIGAHDYGDHTLFVASIEGVWLNSEPQPSSDPLIWINGGPARLATNVYL